MPVPKVLPFFQPPLIDPALYATPQDAILSCKKVDVLAYIDVFVYYLLGLSQGPIHNLSNNRHYLFHSLDQVFRPKDAAEPSDLKQVPYLKKLYQGNCT